MELPFSFYVKSSRSGIFCLSMSKILTLSLVSLVKSKVVHCYGQSALVCQRHDAIFAGYIERLNCLGCTDLSIVTFTMQVNGREILFNNIIVKGYCKNCDKLIAYNGSLSKNLFFRMFVVQFKEI